MSTAPSSSSSSSLPSEAGGTKTADCSPAVSSPVATNRADEGDVMRDAVVAVVILFRHDGLGVAVNAIVGKGPMVVVDDERIATVAAAAAIAAVDRMDDDLFDMIK
jgi:hypothetical protein